MHVWSFYCNWFKSLFIRFSKKFFFFVFGTTFIFLWLFWFTDLPIHSLEPLLSQLYGWLISHKWVIWECFVWIELMDREIASIFLKAQQFFAYPIEVFVSITLLLEFSKIFHSSLYCIDIFVLSTIDNIYSDLWKINNSTQPPAIHKSRHGFTYLPDGSWIIKAGEATSVRFKKKKHLWIKILVIVCKKYSWIQFPKNLL